MSKVGAAAERSNATSKGRQLCGRRRAKRSYSTFQEIKMLNKSLTVSQRNNVCLEEEMKNLKLLSDAAILRSQQIQTSKQQEVNLQTRCHDLQKEVLDLQCQVEALGLKLQKAVTEMDNYKEKLKNKSNEADEYQRELTKLKFESIISDSRHTRLLKEKEDSLMTCQQIYKTLQEELTAKERQEDDLKRRINLAENELEITRTLLNQTKEEVVTLKSERELMLISHQKSVEQLQETLRQKLLNDDNWREKIEAEITKERAQHLVEFQEQALLFKEEAKLELNIEKEKHQEIIQKYKKEQEELQMKVAQDHQQGNAERQAPTCQGYSLSRAVLSPDFISDLIEGATKDLRFKLTALEEKLRKSHVQYTEESALKEKEIENLKSLVVEFESRLKKEIDSNGSVSEDLRKEMKKKSDELERVMLAQTQLIEQFNQSQKEITNTHDKVDGKRKSGKHRNVYELKIIDSFKIKASINGLTSSERNNVLKALAYGCAICFTKILYQFAFPQRVFEEHQQNTWEASLLPRRNTNFTKAFPVHLAEMSIKIRPQSRRSGEGNGIPLQYSCLKIPWMEEPDGLQSMGSLTVGYD
ncbi:hypothetical protein MG293_000383 [Ovis ammon polii]|uniref:Uncharacterized protein n=1 Tax=Ovis ammon polii TaxID=230172 RepID=A0AAD4YHD1_OVIAM|nr:hypothetical protein MG293_000383 [Ovis ammon polii]